MSDFSTMPMADAVAMFAKVNGRTPTDTQIQYRAFIHSLTEGEDGAAGRLELGPDDKFMTERARLKAAAKVEGVDITIERNGSAVLFWLADAPDAQPRLARAPALNEATDIIGVQAQAQADAETDSGPTLAEIDLDEYDEDLEPVGSGSGYGS